VTEPQLGLVGLDQPRRHRQLQRLDARISAGHQGGGAQHLAEAAFIVDGSDQQDSAGGGGQPTRPFGERLF